jgi:hypothetical protein
LVSSSLVTSETDIGEYAHFASCTIFSACFAFVDY